MADNYQQWVPRLAPPWLSDTPDAKYLAGHGAELDRFLDRHRQGILARFPLYAPLDALPLIGRERQLPQGVGETTDEYRLRLRGAWGLWEFAGGHVGLHRALISAGFGGATIVQQNGTASRVVAGEVVFFDLGLYPKRAQPWWWIDDRDTAWARFGLVYPTDPGAALHSLASHEALRAVVHRWKPAKAIFVGATIVATGDTWGLPVENWATRGLHTWGLSRTYWIPAVAYDFATVANVIAWYDSDDLAGTVAATWDSKNGAHQLVGHNDPSIVAGARLGHAAVHFNGVNQYMQTVGWIGGDFPGPFDVLVVAARDPGLVGPSRSLVDGAAGAKRICMYLNGANPVICQAVGVTGAEIIDASWYLWHGRFDGSRSHLLLNNHRSLTNVDVGSEQAIDGITIGSSFDGSSPWLGYVAEAVFVRRLSPVDWWPTIQHLRLKYRL